MDIRTTATIAMATTRSRNPSAQYIASLPVDDAARVEVRLPDPDGKLWVEGRPMSPTGTIRQFKSPVLNAPSHTSIRLGLNGMTATGL